MSYWWFVPFVIAYAVLMGLTIRNHIYVWRAERYLSEVRTYAKKRESAGKWRLRL